MWQETNDSEKAISATMSDAVFRIQCDRLPVDHAYSLAEAICAKVPQLAESDRAGVHAVHLAGSQNGWERPEHSNEHLLLSKRTRLRIRVETEKAEALISALAGSSLLVQGLSMQVLSGEQRVLNPSATLLSRFAYFEQAQMDNDEKRFIEHVVKHCGTLGYSPTKVLCGREHIISTAAGPRLTRSVLLADVPAPSSIALQDNGIGDGRAQGCGIFIPHKDTHAVHDQQDIDTQ